MCGKAQNEKANWTPDKTPAMFVVVSLDEWPEFVQPTGSHDAYKKGGKVTLQFLPHELVGLYFTEV